MKGDWLMFSRRFSSRIKTLKIENGCFIFKEFITSVKHMIEDDDDQMIFDQIFHKNGMIRCSSSRFCPVTVQYINMEIITVIKSKHLDHPLVAGCSISHKSPPC